MIRWIISLILLSWFCAAIDPAAAADVQRDQTQQRAQQQQRIHQDDAIYGAQLMNAQERNQYRKQLRMLKTEQEKERFFLQHREEMRNRAKALGQPIPDSPTPFGMGRGSGSSYGPRKGGGAKGGYGKR